MSQTDSSLTDIPERTVKQRWYGAERIVRVDGAGSPSEVTKRITTGIEAVRSSPVLKDRSTQQ
jgi:hypothetical protein